MSPIRRRKDELLTTESKGGSGPPRVTLAAIEALAIPLVQEVVFMADFRCANCQQRVAKIMSRMKGETQSVTISVLEKKVTLTCTYPSADKLPGRKVAHRSSWSKVSSIMRKTSPLDS